MASATRALTGRSPPCRIIITLALVVGLGFFHSMMYAPQAAFFSETFATRVRYSGASLGVQLGPVLGGAFAPFVATALLARFGSWVPIAVYMAAACVITLVSVFLLAETYQADMDDAEVDPELDPGIVTRDAVS